MISLANLGVLVHLVFLLSPLFNWLYFIFSWYCEIDYRLSFKLGDKSSNMDEIRFSLANEFESGNYSKIIEIIQSKNNAESENQILLILALLKNNPKLARSKLHEILDQDFMQFWPS